MAQKYIRRYISVRKASAASLEGAVKLKHADKAIPLSQFKATQTSKGVRVLVRKKKSAEQHAHWFIATMASGHRGVFVRAGKRREKREKNGKKYTTVLPIKEKFGPTPLGVFTGVPGLMEEVSKDVEEVFAKNLLSQINRFTAAPAP